MASITWCSHDFSYCPLGKSVRGCGIRNSNTQHHLRSHGNNQYRREFVRVTHELRLPSVWVLQAGRPQAILIECASSKVPNSQMINQRRYAGCAESVVDVYDGDVGRAGVQHAQQSGNAAEGCAIADAGGDSEHRGVDHSGDHGG